MITSALKTANARQELELLGRRIEREEDVKRLVRLEPLAGRPGRFVFVIETPFESFPRFVVGTTDAVNEDVAIDTGCCAEWSAVARFDELMEAAIAS